MGVCMVWCMVMERMCETKYHMVYLMDEMMVMARMKCCMIVMAFPIGRKRFDVITTHMQGVTHPHIE